MMTPQELKNSILQLAIQGRLVEQRPEEGTGAELLRDISTRSRGVRGEEKGKSKVAKSSSRQAGGSRPSVVPPEDAPFEIPESWVWVRLGEVCDLLSGRDLEPNEYNDTGNGTIYVTGPSCLSDTGVLQKRWTPNPCVIAYKGDLLLVCKGAGYGKTVICDLNEVHIARQIMALPKSAFVEMNYIRIFLMANIKHIKKSGQGIIPGIDRNSVLSLLLPLPPLAEQKRIMAKIEELLPYVERYEKAWSRLEEFNRRFPEDMRKSVLQMAIQGKLVEQRPEEGTGEELLREILRHETHKTTGTHRTGSRDSRRVPSVSSVPVVPPEDQPFEIPESWVWVRLGQIGSTNIGLTYSPKDVCNEGVIVLRSNNIQNGKMDYADIVKVSCAIPDSKMCHTGDILICARNGSKRLVGKAALIDQDGMSFGAFMAIFRSSCNPYLLYVINSAFFRNALLGETGTTTINQITQDMMKNMPIPLPPLAEQKRIVAKLEEILPLCERLK